MLKIKNSAGKWVNYKDTEAYKKDNIKLQEYPMTPEESYKPEEIIINPIAAIPKIQADKFVKDWKNATRTGEILGMSLPKLTQTQADKLIEKWDKSKIIDIITLIDDVE